VSLGSAKLCVNRCSESSENADVKFFSLMPAVCGLEANPARKNKHHIFAPTAGARCSFSPKRCMVIEDVVRIMEW